MGVVWFTYCSEDNTAHGDCLTAKNPNQPPKEQQQQQKKAKSPQTLATQAERGWAAQILTYSFPDPREINLYAQSITELPAKRAFKGAR